MDILDQELDLGYTPNFNSKSRSGSMKKLSKKPISKDKQPNKKDQVDDLFDDLLDDKKYTKPANTSPTKNNIKKYQTNNQQYIIDVDDYFEDNTTKSNRKPIHPASTNRKSIEIPNTSLTINNNLTTNLITPQPKYNDHRTDTFKLDDHKSQKIEEDQSSIINFGVSTRNMKPPLRKKQKNDQQDLTVFTTKNDFHKSYANLPNDLTLNNTHEINQSKIMKRRSSIQQISNHNFISKNHLANSNEGIYIDDIKQKTNNYKSNTNNNIKTNHGLYLDDKQEDTIKQNQFKPQKNQLIKPPQLTTKNDSITKQFPINYDKQLQVVKLTHKKQLQSLKQALNQQILINKQTRQKMIKQTSEQIQRERDRNKKIHQQDVNRLKEMFEWEKKRIQGTLNNQINTLKHTIQIMKSNQSKYQSNMQSSLMDKKEILSLQDSLRNQKKQIQDRQKLLNKRQFELQQRQDQFNRMKRKEDQRLRQQEKRIMELESSINKKYNEMKREMNLQKQQAAAQIASLQIQVIKKKETLQLTISDLRIQKQYIQRQKEELNKMNKELMNNYKKKMSEIQTQNQRIVQLERDLIKKIRIIQLRGKQLQNKHQFEFNNTKNISTRYQGTKQNNWIVKTKQLQLKNNLQRIENNKEKFKKMERASKSGYKQSYVEKQKFDINNYLLGMAQHNRNKDSIF